MTDHDHAGERKSWPKALGYTLRDKQLVGTLWDYARTSRLSDLYYGERLTWLSRFNFGIELAIAVTASGSGISGLEIVKNGPLAPYWPYLAALTAFLAIAKPLLSLDRQLRHATQQQQTYRRLLSSFEDLALDIQQLGTLTNEHRQRFQRAREMLRQAEEQDDGYVPVKQRQRLQLDVKNEMPAERLWVPPVTLAPSEP